MTRRGKITWGLLLMVLGAAGYAAHRALQQVAFSIVASPNHGRTIEIAAEPALVEYTRLGVSRQLRVAVEPAASLSVWIIEPARLPPRGTVLLLHGIRSQKAHMLGTGRRLAGLGYRSVLVDGRGHGLSSGDWLGFGALEAGDLQQVLDELSRRGLLTANLGVLGHSYGGATGIILAGRDARVKTVVAVTTFANMHEEIVHYARQYGWTDWLKKAPAWTIHLAVWRAGQLGGFDPREASPVEAVKKTTARLLLLHGDADVFIPPDHSRQVHAAAPGQSELVVLPGETHESIFRDTSGVVWSRVRVWFEKWLH
jgi:pimeloyl-ACP methyl ester carboxylesterase